MPLVHECAHPGCNILTMSLCCLEHEVALERRTDAHVVVAAGPRRRESAELR
jgi:hypothetical protein